MSGETIYLVRHGETRWNAEGRIQGKLDSDLTERGIEQARAIGRLLRRHVDRDQPFAIESSPSGRALATARLVAEELGFDPAGIRTTPLLAERHMGSWAGLTLDDVVRASPDADPRRTIDDPAYVQPLTSGRYLPKLPAERPRASRLRSSWVAEGGPSVSFLERADLMIRRSVIWRSLFRTPYPNDERSRAYGVMNNLFLHLHPVRVRQHAVRFAYTFCLGGLSFFLFLVLTVTGVYLMFFYIPSSSQAYTNILEIQSQVTFGLLTRNIHRWAAHLMVFFVFLHMMRVFYHGAYKPPREFNWVVGVVLLFLTIALSFSGYLLPWDQIAFWAITIGTNMAGYFPLINSPFNLLLLGGLEVSQNTLLRFYVAHVMLFPLIAAIFLAVHFWRIRKDGGISGPL